MKSKQSKNSNQSVNPDSKQAQAQRKAMELRAEKAQRKVGDQRSENAKQDIVNMFVDFGNKLKNEGYDDAAIMNEVKFKMEQITLFAEMNHRENS